MAVSAAEYEARINELGAAMKAKEAEKAALHDSAMKYAQVMTWLAALDECISSGKILTANDAEIMRTIVDRIIVRDDGIEIYLRCGV